MPKGVPRAGYRVYTPRATQCPKSTQYANVAPTREWHRKANCRRYPKVNWFVSEWKMIPDRAHTLICGMCPVRNLCFIDAMDYPETKGIRAGLTEYQRELIRKDRHRKTCPGCASGSLIIYGQGQICISCGTSWLCTI